MVLRSRYWLYYALTFMSGARRQIFIVFAGFLMVERFGFDVGRGPLGRTQHDQARPVQRHHRVEPERVIRLRPGQDDLLDLLQSRSAVVGGDVAVHVIQCIPLEAQAG